MEKKDDRNDGALWFKQAKVATTTVSVAQLCPIPAVYAYDVIIDAIPVHVLLERIKFADLQNNEDLLVRSYILNFLQVAHTDHNASNTAFLVDIGTNPFMARQHTKDAKQWAKEKAAKLFGTGVRVAGTVAVALPASPAGATQQAPPQDFQKIAEALITIQVAGSPAKAAGNAAIVADTDANWFKTHMACVQWIWKGCLQCAASNQAKRIDCQTAGSQQWQQLVTCQRMEGEPLYEKRSSRISNMMSSKSQLPHSS